MNRKGNIGDGVTLFVAFIFTIIVSFILIFGASAFASGKTNENYLGKTTLVSDSSFIFENIGSDGLLVYEYLIHLRSRENNLDLDSEIKKIMKARYDGWVSSGKEGKFDNCLGLSVASGSTELWKVTKNLFDLRGRSGRAIYHVDHRNGLIRTVDLPHDALDIDKRDVREEAFYYDGKEHFFGYFDEVCGWIEDE